MVCRQTYASPIKVRVRKFDRPGST